MKVTVALFITSAAALDCTGLRPWNETRKYKGGSKVTYQHDLYEAQWFAEPEVVPNPDSMYEAWKIQGPCDEGSDEQYNPNLPDYDGPQVDCTGITPWIGSKAYTEPGVQVTYSGVLWVNKYWTQSVPPDVDNGGPWNPVGVCIEWSDEPAPESYGLSEALERMMCSCCKGCATIAGMKSVCLDDAEVCYFTDCRKYNVYDEDACDEMVKTGRFLYYPGDVKAPTVKAWPQRLFAPYFDAGLDPFPRLSEIATRIGVNFFNAAFITAADSPIVGGCKGAWAAGLPITQGPVAWNDEKNEPEYLYDEINRLRQLGGDIIVSFGGASNMEIADSRACQEGDPIEDIFRAYNEAVEYLHLTHINFHIQDRTLSVSNRNTGWKYRFAAVKKLKEAHPDLKIWWTLPITPDGLTSDGKHFVVELFSVDAPWELINAMTMDYGDEACPTREMGECERSAITNLARDIFEIAKQTNQDSNFGFAQMEDVYPRLGSTPMIGMNDQATEVYGLDDARRSMEEWKTKPLGLVAQWSLTRDQPCPESPTNDLAFPDCSSLADQTSPYEFAAIFRGHTSA